ncbi:unnamed protein product, partial [Urochloa humidicola]
VATEPTPLSTPSRCLHRAGAPGGGTAQAEVAVGFFYAELHEEDELRRCPLPSQDDNDAMSE